MSEVEFLPAWYVRRRRARARLAKLVAAACAACLISIVVWYVLRNA